MPRRCPPGVLCIENMTIFILFLILGIILFLIYSHKNSNQSNVVIKEQVNTGNESGLFPRPSFSFSNVQEDVLLNPYQAPLRDDRFLPNYGGGGGGAPGIPINIKTQGYDTNYRQVGILTRIAGAEMILPLMGRPLLTNRDKWNFYTMTDKNNMFK